MIVNVICSCLHFVKPLYPYSINILYYFDKVFPRETCNLWVEIDKFLVFIHRKLKLRSTNWRKTTGAWELVLKIKGHNAKQIFA